MSSFAHKKTEDGLTNKYHINLKRQIEKGDQFFVCRNEELCKEVQSLLRNANGQKIHNLFTLDTLAVMEESLQSFPSKTGQKGLEKLFKAFEVLELAALNLYIYPWRREYRLVKMFSGMFTHLIKPTLTLQQTKELFGLLGYEPSSNNQKEELALNLKPVPADFLLSLACGFFVARMECQLLLSASGSVNRDVEWVLQLIKERQVGHSLQLALENTKVKSEAARASVDIVTGGSDGDVDLYTAQDASHGTSSSCSPPHSPYSKSFRKDPSQLDFGNNDDAMRRRSLGNNNPGPVENIADDQSESDAGKVMCRCITPDELYIYQCEICREVHSPMCVHYKKCRNNKHALALWSHKAEDFHSRQDQSRLAKEKSKDLLKTHHCVASSTSETFLVCYDCQLIHDHSCSGIKNCNMLTHNIKPTGRIQPAQGERLNSQRRHACLLSGGPVYVICHTCKYSHDFLCKDGQNCIKEEHRIQHTQEVSTSESPCLPIPHHHCCDDGQFYPNFVCFTCQVFHTSRCADGWHCSEKHKIQELATKCVDCSSFKLFMLCRFCGALYCKECWFKSPLSCKCGKPFDISTPV